MFNDFSDGIDLSTDIPYALPIVPALPNSPDAQMEWNYVPYDIYVDPALVDPGDSLYNVMPGADAAASSAGTLNPANKNPSSWSFFSDTFKNLSGGITSAGTLITKQNSDSHRLTSSPTGNVGAQGNPPPINEALSTANRALETVTSSYDQFLSWDGMLGSIQPVAKKTVVQPKTQQKNTNMMLVAGALLAGLLGVFLVAR